jgi:hypothetical protein
MIEAKDINVCYEEEMALDNRGGCFSWAENCSDG